MSIPSLRPSLSAIVLAGGLSSRMGQDKALIEIDGLPLLLRVCQVAEQVADSVYLVTAWGNRYRDLCAAAGVQLIPELLPSGVPQGPVCGFLQGLARVQTDWVLLLACDLPNLSAKVLGSWRDLLATAPPDVMALLPPSPPSQASGWEPLCGFYRSQCQSSLRAFSEAGGRSFQTWLKQQSVQPLPDCDPAMLFNCNTPADLRRYFS